MARPLVGRTVKRLRKDKGLSQQALAVRLGISPSYLNLIEHDQRAITASLLLKLADTLGVDLPTLSGTQEKQLEHRLREVLSDPLLGLDSAPDEEIAAISGSSPTVVRAMLALYRAWRVAREDSSGISLPSGRRVQVPNEEASDFFDDRANHFPELESAARHLGESLGNVKPVDMNHALADRLRRVHGLTVTMMPLTGALRRYDPDARSLALSESLPRESRDFQLAFQLALLEANETVEALVTAANASSPEAATLIRIGLLNYTAGALLMPYSAFCSAARTLRHDVDSLAARFGVSFEQACNRLSTLQRSDERGVPLFFLRVDPAGNILKRFTAAGYPFTRYGGSCPRWIAHTAFSKPGELQVQVAELPDGAQYLCFARAITSAPAAWGEPRPMHTIAMGCAVSHADEFAYADGLDLERAKVGIGLSCRLCERPNCRSRAFPPLEHRLSLAATSPALRR